MKKQKQRDSDKQLSLNEIIKSEYARFQSSFENIDLSSFSYHITLQDYQIAALKNALIALNLYQDKESFFRKYLDFRVEIRRNEINRASFWMATGSGKTIVMIKLMAILAELFKDKTLEKKPIMLLVPNDKILRQFRERIDEFNRFSSKALRLKDLKDYETSDFNDNLFNETTIYISRSDLLDTSENVGKDSKAKRLNFKNYLHQNGWYILLDEAHKGDSKDSVRKAYINELAKGFDNKSEFAKGFIFNFSATFSDELDLNTCAFNYNLERFNNDGFGKNIAILDSDLKAFKDRQNDEEKREKIIESFILFNAIVKSKQRLFSLCKQQKINNLYYHNPLIIAVSDKVNTQDAGVKLYFETILQILRTEINIESIAQNLYENLKEQSLYFAKSGLSSEFLEFIKTSNAGELRENIFYTDSLSSLEICKIKGNDKEIAFKSKNSTKPFLLLNIGNAKEWEKEYLVPFKIEQGEDLQSGYFENINDTLSPINIMMGSKIFSEGWDSNRVNLISFINIGSKNAKKYVLQTIGRGVRIEPFLGFRQRFEKSDVDFSIKENLKGFADGLETLFIMASDEGAIKGILEGIEGFITTNKISGFKKNAHLKPLLVPTYTKDTFTQRSYQISQDDFRNLKDYIARFDEDVFLFKENLRTKDMGLKTLQKIKNQENIVINGSNAILQTQDIFRILDNFFHTKTKAFKEFKELENEISHFSKMTSTLESTIVNEINNKIKEILESSKVKSFQELLKDYQAGKITEVEFEKQSKQNRESSIDIYDKTYTLNAKLKEHYYNPLIIDNKEDLRINYAVSNSSEKDFLENLQKYIDSKDNVLENYEWCFCHLIENIDFIFIPYFDSTTQSERSFYPDFIFWLKHKQTKSYTILFIDPKGLKLAQDNARDKIKGFECIFKDKKLDFRGENIAIKLFYYNTKGGSNDTLLKSYIKSSCAEIFEALTRA